MTDELTPLSTATLTRWEVLAEQASHYADQAQSTNTRRAYDSDFRHFAAWCEGHEFAPLPATPAVVAAYVADLAEQAYKVATINRRLTAIRRTHEADGHESPTTDTKVRQVMKGIRRALSVVQEQKAPATVEVVRLMLGTLEDNLIGTRDRAMLLVGFAGAFRRSELVALDVADLEWTVNGLVVTLRRSKTDQEGESRKVGIPHGTTTATCPVRSLRAWLDAAAIAEGAIFRGVNRYSQLQAKRLSPYAVALIVKRAAERAGLNPALFGGHSLRAGLATSAAAAGATERAIMAQTGHKSEKMVRRYIREGSLFRDNAAGLVGL